MGRLQDAKCNKWPEGVSSKHLRTWPTWPLFTNLVHLGAVRWPISWSFARKFVPSMMVWKPQSAVMQLFLFFPGLESILSSKKREMSCPGDWCCLDQFRCIELMIRRSAPRYFLICGLAQVKCLSQVSPLKYDGRRKTTKRKKRAKGFQGFLYGTSGGRNSKGSSPGPPGEKKIR